MIGVNINPYAGVYKRAVELFNGGYYEEAFIKLDVIVKNDFENYMANYYIAECYFDGKGTKQNYELAYENYTISASNRHIESIYKVGYCLEFGLGVSKDDYLMISRYTFAAKSGHVLAQYRLGLCYKNGRGVDKNINVAAKYFLNAAKKGFVDAQREGAICYEILNQPTTSATLYLAAAEQKDPYSCYKIGKFYEIGYGCEAKYELAMHFYITAATLGNEDAILTIAEKYKKGEGLEKSHKNAINWWKKIKDSNSIAVLEIAKSYLGGYGVEKDLKKAITYLKQAADLKNSEACVILAKIYKSSDDEEETKNYVKYLVRATEYKSIEAMHLLGVYHEEKENIKEAYRWFSMAASNDYEPSINSLKKYKKTLFGGIKLN